MYQTRILLAEDNLINREVALALLGRLGYTVHAVSDGAQAVKALQAGVYDLVLMDCEMPDMDGFEATSLIRGNAAGAFNAAIPIVAVTADAMAGDRERCIRAGMDDYLTKPIDLQELGQTIEKWLHKPVRPAVPESRNLPPATQPLFDAAGLLKRLMGNKALAQKILSAFLEDIPAQLSSLHGALEAGDATGARRLAHTVKGAAATVSATAVRDAALETEEAAKAGNMDRLPTLLAGLERRFEDFKVALAASGWERG